MYYFVSTFNFNLNHYKTKEKALKHYLSYHVPVVKKMPGIKRYIIGGIEKTKGEAAQYDRMAILVFESREALRDAYHSEIGKAVMKDENTLIGDYTVQLVESDEILSE
jgi:uncharacterized protein (TIGR02118 family)